MRRRSVLASCLVGRSSLLLGCLGLCRGLNDLHLGRRGLLLCFGLLFLRLHCYLGGLFGLLGGLFFGLLNGHLRVGILSNLLDLGRALGIFLLGRLLSACQGCLLQSLPPVFRFDSHSLLGLLGLLLGLLGLLGCLLQSLLGLLLGCLLGCLLGLLGCLLGLLGCLLGLLGCLLCRLPLSLSLIPCSLLRRCHCLSCLDFGILLLLCQNCLGCSPGNIFGTINSLLRFRCCFFLFSLVCFVLSGVWRFTVSMGDSGFNRHAGFVLPHVKSLLSSLQALLELVGELLGPFGFLGLGLSLGSRLLGLCLFVFLLCRGCLFFVAGIFLFALCVDLGGLFLVLFSARLSGFGCICCFLRQGSLSHLPLLLRSGHLLLWIFDRDGVGLLSSILLRFRCSLLLLHQPELLVHHLHSLWPWRGYRLGLHGPLLFLFYQRRRRCRHLRGLLGLGSGVRISFLGRGLLCLGALNSLRLRFHDLLGLLRLSGGRLRWGRGRQLLERVIGGTLHVNLDVRKGMVLCAFAKAVFRCLLRR